MERVIGNSAKSRVPGSCANTLNFVSGLRTGRYQDDLNKGLLKDIGVRALSKSRWIYRSEDQKSAYWS